MPPVVPFFSPVPVPAALVLPAKHRVSSTMPNIMPGSEGLKLTEQQIVEFQEAFSLFDKVSRLRRPKNRPSRVQPRLTSPNDASAFCSAAHRTATAR